MNETETKAELRQKVQSLQSQLHQQQQPSLSNDADLAGNIEHILSAASVEQLWYTLADTLRSTLQVHQLALYQFDEETERLRSTHVIGLSQHCVTHPELIKTIVTCLQEQTKAQLLYPQRDRMLSVACRDLFANEKIISIAIFPLENNRASPDGLLIAREAGQPFTTTELNLCALIARITAVTLRNIQLLTETTTALYREQQFNYLTRTLNSTLDIPTILAAVAHTTTEMIGAEAGLIGLAIEGQIITFYPYNTPPRFNLQPALRGRGIHWQIMETGEPILLEQYASHPKAQYDWVRNGVKAFIAVPIVAGENYLGVIELFNMTSTRQFNRRDLALVESIGQQAGTSIQNARLYAEAQQRAGELALALAKQEELDNLKTLFIQNVSHELRTPLGIIYGHAELLDSGVLGQMLPEQANSVSIIARRARMLTDMVDDLSALLAAETRNMRHDIIDPTMLIRAILADFHIKAKEANISLAAEISENLPNLIGDQNQLRRVFDNLIGNSLKFTPEGGNICVAVWEEAKELIIEISDTGIGIPTEQHKQIFDRFYQVDGSTRRRYQGTGLGLALVKEIVEAHRGRVSVSSTVDVGTTFHVRLPASHVDPHPPDLTID